MERRAELKYDHELRMQITIGYRRKWEGWRRRRAEAQAQLDQRLGPGQSERALGLECHCGEGGGGYDIIVRSAIGAEGLVDR